MATILYNDRINTHRHMQQLSKQLDEAPSEAAVKELAELRIRNLQAFAELRSLSDKGHFLFKHILLTGRTELAELSQLYRRNPEEFLHQHKLTADNVRRYRSYLNSPKRADRRDRDQSQLDYYERRKRLFLEVIEH